MDEMEEVDSVALQGGLALIKKIEKAKKGETDGQPSANHLIRKEFQWDDIIKWLVAAIFGLTLLNLSTDFFRDYVVTCYAPNVTSRDSTAYINNYCYSSLPKSEYFTLFIIIHGFIIIGPHMLWKTAFDSNYNFFFDLVNNLDRLRDSESGEFSIKNFKIVSRLETELSRTIPLKLPSNGMIHLPPIYTGYLVKLFVQLMAALGSMIFSLSFFVDFSEMFICPTIEQQDSIINDATKWPVLNEPVTCVYPSLRFLSLLRYGDIILLFFIIFAVSYGLMWTLSRHPEELGSQTEATFSAQSNLHRDSYRPCSFLKNPFRPAIKSDIDFLLLALYHASSGQGVTFKQLQISQEMKQQYNRNSELLQLIVTHKVQMSDSIHDAEQAGVEEAEVYRQSEATELYRRAGFRWPVRIDFKGTPRFEVEALDRQELGLVEDREQAPNKAEIKAIAEHLQSTDAENLEDFFKILFRKTSVKPVFPNKSKVGRDYTLLTDSYQTMLNQWSQKGGSIRLLRDTLIERKNGHEEIAAKLVSGELGNRKPNIKQDRSFQNRLYGFVQLVKPHCKERQHMRLAVDISFDGLGCSFILAWSFDAVCVLNFHSHFRNNIKKVKEDRLLNQVKIITLPLDYYSLPANPSDNFDDCLKNLFFMSPPNNPDERASRRKGEGDSSDKYVNLFTVGPVSEDSRRVTVNLLLERFNTSSDIAKNCLMLAIRPLQINGTDVRHQFLRYIPPLESLEDEEEQITLRGGAQEEESSITNMSQLREALGESSYRTVGGEEGLLCYSGDVECVIEMKLYRYFGRRL